MISLTANDNYKEVLKFISDNAITGGISTYTGYHALNFNWSPDFCFLEEDDLSINTDDWNPLTFAIYIRSMPLIKLFLDKYFTVVKKGCKLPNETPLAGRQALFPLLMAFEGENDEMFDYFLNTHYILWIDDYLFISLIKLLLKSNHQIPNLVKYL